MVEVTGWNFNEIYPDIVRDINSASFIAVDCEFTGGLRPPDVLKPSLFDNGSERYDKHRISFDSFIISEIGISAFRFCNNENKYVASTYNIFLYPDSFLSWNRGFHCDSQSLKFLGAHGFDFNTFVNKGVSFLDKVQESQLRCALEEWQILDCYEFSCLMTREDGNMLQNVCDNIMMWIPTAEKSTSCNVSDKGANKYLPADVTYVIHKVLRTKFKNIWTYTEGNEIRVTKVDESERHELENEEQRNGTLENDIVDRMLGCTKIFTLLSNVKKPVVGHNCLLDLLFIYKQFYRPLPVKYSDFKKSIHELFPVVFDTKVLGYELIKILCGRNRTLNTSLDEMYNYCNSNYAGNEAFTYPVVESNNYNLEDPRFHEAGWDSYCTGFCFAHMAKYLALRKYQRTGSEYFQFLQEEMNQIKIVRARSHNIALHGPDPETDRPPLLIIRAKNSADIDMHKVVHMLGMLGTIDVKQHKKNSFLVAVPCERLTIGTVTFGIGAALVFWGKKKF